MTDALGGVLPVKIYRDGHDWRAEIYVTSEGKILHQIVVKDFPRRDQNLQRDYAIRMADEFARLGIQTDPAQVLAILQSELSE